MNSRLVFAQIISIWETKPQLICLEQVGLLYFAKYFFTKFVFHITYNNFVICYYVVKFFRQSLFKESDCILDLWERIMKRKWLLMTLLKIMLYGSYLDLSLLWCKSIIVCCLYTVRSTQHANSGLFILKCFWFVYSISQWSVFDWRKKRIQITNIWSLTLMCVKLSHS